MAKVHIDYKSEVAPFLNEVINDNNQVKIGFYNGKYRSAFYYF